MSNRPKNDDVQPPFPVPQSVATARAGTSLPLSGSEDARERIRRPRLPFVSEPKEFAPDTIIDWTVDAFLPTPLNREEATARFPLAWMRQIRRPELYGRVAGEGRTTYARAPGAWSFDVLSFAFRLVDTSDEEPRILDEHALTTALDALVERLPEARVEPRESVRDGAARAMELRALYTSCNIAAIVRISRGRAPIEGRLLWDAMLCIGMTWGDLDQFHLMNPPNTAGDRRMFSAWTTTEPGYFLPEEIAAGSSFDDVVLGFVIARSAMPQESLTSMLDAADYLAARFGGQITDGTGGSFDERALRDKLARVENELRRAGVPPGSTTALRLFGRNCLGA